MDAALSSIVDFIDGVNPNAVEVATTEQVVRHVVDTIACGGGGVRSAPARIARTVTEGASGSLVASTYGMQHKVLVDAAAFANATANRYLDFNDFGSSGHPSDMIPAVLAMAEAVGASGTETVAAIAIAYAIATDLAESVPSTGGWDQGVFSSLGVAGALAKLLRLDRERTANALSLAIVPSVPLKVTRFGELSEWKAAAVPHASMTASFAVRLAQAGMSAPPAPFSGRFGLFEQVWPEFTPSLGEHALRAIERSSLKRFGACYWGQVAIDIAVGLREEIGQSRISAVHVASSDAAVRVIGGGIGDRAEKWRPPTRETADHSMPFLVASALRDGVIDESTFDVGQLADPDRLALMDRITVVADETLTARSTRDRCPTYVKITLEDGRILTREQDFPRGHPQNPMSDGEIRQKFDLLISDVLNAADASALADLLWSLPTLPNLDAIGALLRRFDIGDQPASGAPAPSPQRRTR